MSSQRNLDWPNQFNNLLDQANRCCEFIGRFSLELTLKQMCQAYKTAEKLGMLDDRLIEKFDEVSMKYTGRLLEYVAEGPK